MEDLIKLADLLKEQNALLHEIALLIGRPAIPGHICEYIASKIFDIKPNGSASTAGHDGYFRSGKLARRYVNIKYAGRQERLLNLNPIAKPDYYLVLTGPNSSAMSSKLRHRPFIIQQVFLFEAK